MGCFNLSGGISKIPITYKDECFLRNALNNIEQKN